MGNGISRGWERKSRTGRFATGRFRSCTWKYFLSVRKKSITENFVKRKLRPSSVSVMVQRIYSSWALSPMRFTTFFSRIVKPIISFSKKSTFLPCKSLLCLHNKQNNRWSLADMELLFSSSTRYQEIITVYILFLDTLFVRCSRSRDNKLNIQREILYQITRQNSRVCHTASIQKIP